MLSPPPTRQSPKALVFFTVWMPFSPALPSVRQRQWVRSPPPARQSPKALVFFAVRVLFLRSCLWCAKGNGYSLPLRLAQIKKHGSFSLYGCFFFGLAFGAPKAMGALPLRLAKVQKRWSFSLCGFLPPTFCKQKAALSRRKRRLSAGQINKITSRVQRPAFRSNSSSCWPVARSQAVNTPFSYSI